MITYLAPRDQSYTLAHYLDDRGKALRERITVLSYESAIDAGALPRASTVFSAVDQLTRTERRLATRMWEALAAAAPELRLLNHPERVRCRHDLLHAAHAVGANAFRVCRPPRVPADLRYPVFVRLEHEHTGSLTQLIPDRRALRRTLLELLVRGYRWRDLMVVEYCNTADAHGDLYKYSAYCVGGTIVPAFLMVSADWVTKANVRRVNDDTAREEFAFVQRNPHAEWVRAMFTLACIDYGRIDYGVLDGRPQMWEINMNPTIGRRQGSPSRLTDAQRLLREPTRSYVTARFQDAWAHIDTASPAGGPVPFAVSDDDRRRVAAERRAAQRVVARRARMQRVADAHGVAALRRLWRAFAPDSMRRD
jgi:hypothetical protein